MTGPGGADSAVDWSLAAAVGGRLAPAGVRLSAAARAEITESLATAARAAEDPVRELTGLAAGLPIPEAQIVDRAGWTAAAADSMAALLAVPDPGADSLLRPLSSRLSGLQAGGLLAVLSTAILGQYDPFTGPDGRLLLVLPNIVGVERSLRLRPRDFRMWVCLHEVTHRVQFAGAPWLGDYMRDSVAALAGDSDQTVAETIRHLSAVVERRRAGTAPAEEQGVIGLVTALQGPDQRAAIERMLTLGTLLEGHADHVMDAVGPQVVPTVAQIRTAFDDRRSRNPNPIQRLLRALLGIDVKIAQYVRGKAFVDTVVDRIGMDGFNAVFQDADTLPRGPEIADPDRWIARVHG